MRLDNTWCISQNRFLFFSNTRRHLCEFTGLDMEMAIQEHYDEVMDVFSDLFIHIFDGINQRCKNELERVREQHPFEDLKYLRPTLKLTYAEGCALLRAAGVEQVRLHSRERYDQSTY